jgi:hypothetical protein
MIVATARALIQQLPLILTMNFLFLSCTQVHVIDKSRERHFEMRDVKVPLIEWTTLDYLRQQYAVNAKLSERQILALQREIDKRGVPVADVEIVNAQGPGEVLSVARSGDRVVVIGELYIAPLGDFYRAKLPTGEFLVPKNEAAPRLGPALPVTAQMMIDPPVTKGRVPTVNSRVNPESNAAPVATEEERLAKLTSLLQQNPSWKNYESFVKARQITVGLPEELLKLSWGQPLKIKERTVPLKQIKVFTYPKNYQIYLIDGLVHSWEKK